MARRTWVVRTRAEPSDSTRSQNSCSRPTVNTTTVNHEAADKHLGTTKSVAITTLVPGLRTWRSGSRPRASASRPFCYDNSNNNDDGNSKNTNNNINDNDNNDSDSNNNSNNNNNNHITITININNDIHINNNSRSELCHSYPCPCPNHGLKSIFKQRMGTA